MFQGYFFYSVSIYRTSFSHSFRVGLPVTNFKIPCLWICLDVSFITEGCFQKILNSGLTVHFFQHLKNIVQLPPILQFLTTNPLSFKFFSLFLSGCFQFFFFFCLLLSAVWLWCVLVWIFFWFLLFGVCSDSWVCRFMSSDKFGTLQSCAFQ